MNHLGIDFGLKNIGLSLAEGPLASPLTQNFYTSDEKMFQFLLQLIKEHEIEVLVIGISEGKLATKIKIFGTRLSQLTNLPVHYQDETLSSYEAKIKMIQAHAPQKKRRLDHKIAATIILQSYLDDLTNH
ncbi:MAG: Holliday junction resolvase RuvX [Candidatus Beckwithbacteria bacterium]|nr:Holliday junction resolvase RuvX [Patescibacteria group bacterium]